MKLTYNQKIKLLGIALLFLIAFIAFGSWLAPLRGEAGPFCCGRYSRLARCR
jgi:hypothetical protein